MKPFEELPSSWFAIIVPWIIALGILYFDFAQGYKTNPIIVFGFPIIVTVIFMPHDSFASIKNALGLAMPTIKEKLMNLVGAIGGLMMGAGFYYILTVRTRMQVLYFIPASLLAETGVGATGIAIIYSVVAIGEELMCILFTKIAANKLSGHGMNTLIAIVLGASIARIFWSSLHYFSYGGFTLATLPAFIVAWALGTMFAAVAVGLAQITNKNLFYFVVPTITAHWMFNIMTAMNLSLLI